MGKVENRSCKIIKHLSILGSVSVNSTELSSFMFAKFAWPWQPSWMGFSVKVNHFYTFLQLILAENFHLFPSAGSQNCERHKQRPNHAQPVNPFSFMSPVCRSQQQQTDELKMSAADSWNKQEGRGNSPRLFQKPFAGRPWWFVWIISNGEKKISRESTVICFLRFCWLQPNVSWCQPYQWIHPSCSIFLPTFHHRRTPAALHHTQGIPFLLCVCEFGKESEGKCQHQLTLCTSHWQWLLNKPNYFLVS